MFTAEREMLSEDEEDTEEKSIFYLTFCNRFANSRRFGLCDVRYPELGYYVT